MGSRTGFTPETRRQIFERDGWRCQAPDMLRRALPTLHDEELELRAVWWLRQPCVSTLEAHHVVSRGQGGTSRAEVNDVSNGLTLCGPGGCHARAESYRWLAEAAGICKRRGAAP